VPTQGDINRVSSLYLDRERAALEASSSNAANSYARLQAVEVSKQDEGVIPSSPEMKSELQMALDSIEGPQTAGSSRAEFVGRVDEVIDDEPVSVAAVTKLLTEHFANQAGNRESDLDKFKTQVIRAFKHLGLDTVKHFGV
jgi:hypothetical protein